MLIGVIALAAFAWREYSTVFAPGRNKKQIDQTAQVANQTAQQAVVVHASAEELKAVADASAAAHLAVIANRDAIDDGVNGRIECAKAMLATDKNPTAAEVAAQIMLDDAQAALGRELTDKERAFWTKLSVPLIQRQQEALAEAQRQREIAENAIAARDATQAESLGKDKLLGAQATTIEKKSGQLVTYATKNASLTAQVKQWADQEPDLWARIEALCILVVLLVGGLIWYEIHRRGVDGALKDAVSLKEAVQTEATKLGADATALHQNVDAWWESDPKGKAAFDAVKAKLRL